jgi:microcompartment protein CcmK/EutM
VVVWDDLGAGMGDKIALAQGPEAAQPFRPELKPVDAYNAAILDRINLDEPQ